MGKSNSYTYVYNYFKDKNCKLLSLSYKNNMTPLIYIATCGHQETVTFSKFISYDRSLCKKCKHNIYDKNISENMNKTTYNKIRKIIKNKILNSLKLKKDFYPDNINKTQKCNNCKENKRLYLFSNSKSKCGKSKTCRECCNKHIKNKRFSMNQEQIIIELLKSCRSNAQEREKKGRLDCGNFKINKCDIYNLIKKQNNKCFYSGTELIWIYKHPNKPSIDRIDCNKGYTIDNIQLVTKRINQMRGNLEHKEFLEIIKDIYKNKFL